MQTKTHTALIAAALLAGVAWPQPVRATPDHHQPERTAAAQDPNLPGHATANDENATGVGDETSGVPLREPARTQAPIGGETAGTASLRPDLRGPALTWFAVVVILMVTLQNRPVLSLRNADGLVLALTCLLLVLRASSASLPRGATGQTWQWWSYLLLSVAAGYWLFRGVHLVWSRSLPAATPNLSNTALAVLLAVGLVVSIHQIATAPMSAGSRDGIIGGVCLTQTGRLPYGEAAGHDTRSPLLYLLHAGGVRLFEPTMDSGREVRPLSWERRDRWIATEWWQRTDATAARLVNGFLFVALLAALAGIGRRLHSVNLGLTLPAVFCVFPGVLECLPRPEIMLPAALLAWSVTFAQMRALGGMLATLSLVLAGLAWPWAWLGLPVMLAYFFRRGWQAVGSTVGFLGGAAACIVGLTGSVAPSLPRADGALAAAGLQSAYRARLTDDGTLVVTRREPSDESQADFKAPLWKFLVTSEHSALDRSGDLGGLRNVALPNGVDGTTVLYRAVEASGAARAQLQRGYRQAIATMPDSTRMWVALRSVLEAIWLAPVHPPRDIRGTWSLWSRDDPQSAARWTLVRRAAKGIVGLLSLAVAALFLFGQATEPRQLVGGLLVVCSAALFTSEQGAVTNLVWLLPLILAVLAAGSDEQIEQVAPPAADEPPLDIGPAPRITVEN